MRAEKLAILEFAAKHTAPHEPEACRTNAGWEPDQCVSGHWVLVWDLATLMPDRPYKVVQSWAASLVRKGYLDGCGCGCRGDFEITDKGREALEL